MRYTARCMLFLMLLQSQNVIAVTKTDVSDEVTSVVYNDRDGNGTQGRGEPGIHDVAVSNGRDVVRTDRAGRYRLSLSRGQTLFVVKPAGWRVPRTLDSATPLLWRHAPPEVIPSLRYGGMPAGPVPTRFDVGFQREVSDKTDQALEVRVFGDPQVKSHADVGYYARDIVDGVMADRKRIDLGISLGDIADDNLSLYPALNAETRRLQAPWLHVSGNHDIDFDAASDQDALLTFRNTYGPDTFAWEEGNAIFIGLDNVIYRPGERPAYIGGFRGEQFTFLQSYLAGVPKDRLLVLAMHIPLFEPEGRDTFRDEDRERFFALLAGFQKILILSAHSHTQRHWFHNAKTGWKGAQALHEYNVGAACGAYWSGVKDARGVPETTMADGTPNGYASLRIGSDGVYALAWHPAKLQDGEHSDIGLHAPKVLRQGAYPGYGVYANVYMGRDDSRVEFRIDDGEWRAMSKVARADPRLLAENLRDDVATQLRGYDRSPEAEPSPHLWRGTLPTDLPLGVHRIEVRAFDAWHGEIRTHTEYRLDTVAE